MAIPSLIESKLDNVTGGELVVVSVQEAIERHLSNAESKESKKEEKKEKKVSEELSSFLSLMEYFHFQRTEKDEGYYERQRLVNGTLYWTMFIGGNFLALAQGFILMVLMIFFHFPNDKASYVQVPLFFVSLFTFGFASLLGRAFFREGHTWSDQRINSSTVILKCIIMCLATNACGSICHNPDPWVIVNLYRLPFVLVDFTTLLNNFCL